MTNGDKQIDSRQFYLRLVQRIIHLFNVRTSFGILYEVDVRLRPQGDAGLLACSLSAFYDYQMHVVIGLIILFVAVSTLKNSHINFFTAIF